MDTLPPEPAVPLATPPASQLLPSGAKLGPVHLVVSDAERARAFWTTYVGLTELPADEEELHLGAGGDELIVLHSGASTPVPSRRTGLYHVAIHLPVRKELARVVARLFALRYPNSPTDHAETEATYFSDPDGNGIELTFETPERGELAIVDGKPVARMADGTLQPGTAALDVSSLLGELAAEDDLGHPMPSSTRIGHVHLHVRDMNDSIHFHQDVIGFGPHLNMASFRMADFSLKTSFIPHALALNTWQGAGALPPPADASGLRHWTLMVPERNAVNEIASRLTEAGFSFIMNEGDSQGRRRSGPYLKR
jgi:catechol 2,3-dioxygenase